MVNKGIWLIVCNTCMLITFAFKKTWSSLIHMIGDKNKTTPNDKTSFVLVVLDSSFPLYDIDAIFVFRLNCIL